MILSKLLPQPIEYLFLYLLQDSLVEVESRYWEISCFYLEQKKRMPARASRNKDCCGDFIPADRGDLYISQFYSHQRRRVAF